MNIILIVRDPMILFGRSFLFHLLHKIFGLYPKLFSANQIQNQDIVLFMWSQYMWPDIAKLVWWLKKAQNDKIFVKNYQIFVQYTIFVYFSSTIFPIEWNKCPTFHIFVSSGKFKNFVLQLR